MAAGEGNIELLARQTRLLRPDVVAITTPAHRPPHRPIGGSGEGP
ncbi:hypothetical protein [Actinomadura rubrisoli]|nr:hypothetical protein [Actinomadura rubrisoli]